MVKAFWFMIKVGLLVALAVWVADHPGYVLIEFPDHAFKARVHTGLFLLILLGTILLAIFLFRIIHWIANFPNTWRKYRAYQRREKGYRALTLGLTAVAAGDQKQAAYHAARAEKFLPGDHGLPVLLMAQSQRLQGLEAEAAQSFRRLLENKDTSFLGVRGLLQAALDHENFAQALELSYEALALHPKQKWILCTVYDLELRQHRWEQAKAILKRAEKAKAIDHDRAASDRAAMLIAQAEDALGAGDVAQTESYLKQAHRARPDFIPAAVYLARFYRDQGQRNKAVRIVEKSWRAQAHPDLAVLWASLMPPHKAGQLSARLSWFEKLVKWQPCSPESHIALAGEALDQKLWGEAREHLGRAELQRPSAKIYRLLADLEKRAGQGAQAEDYWLEKAASALPDHVWVCRDSGQIYQEWQAIAQPHGSFNTIVWDVPANAGLLKAARQEFLSDRL